MEPWYRHGRDFFPAIQWGTGKSKYAWKMRDWVEGAVLCSNTSLEANGMADSLPREGVLHYYVKIFPLIYTFYGMVFILVWVFDVMH